MIVVESKTSASPFTNFVITSSRSSAFIWPWPTTRRALGKSFFSRSAICAGVSTGAAIEDGVDQCDEARAAAIEAVADSGNEILACEEAGITQSIFRSQ